MGNRKITENLVLNEKIDELERDDQQPGRRKVLKGLWHFSNGDSLSGRSGYSNTTNNTTITTILLPLQVHLSLVLVGAGSAPSDTYWENLAKSIDVF